MFVHPLRCVHAPTVELSIHRLVLPVKDPISGEKDKTFNLATLADIARSINRNVFPLERTTSKGKQGTL